MIQIKYICDVCRTEVDSQLKISRVSIPKLNSNREQDCDTVDLCPECRKNLMVFINSMKKKENGAA